jgi:hypothetical protein
MEAEQQGAHTRRYLLRTLLQNGLEGNAQGVRAGPHRDALFDQEGADLVDRCRPARDQPRAHPMQRLDVELGLALLCDEAHVRSQRRLRDGFGVVVIVLLPLRERLHVDRRDDPALGDAACG